MNRAPQQDLGEPEFLKGMRDSLSRWGEAVLREVRKIKLRSPDAKGGEDDQKP
jgi:hypothetical protein